jgi:UDP-2-acetamido-3-amino-2,3-dideoxy-glucuronate N-acetyltransferase
VSDSGDFAGRVEPRAADYFVHESSYVDQPCTIGAGTKIWHFSHVMKNCRIGQQCNIGQNVVISSGCVVGNNVKIQNNVSVYTGVELEDDVFCGPSMVFTNVVTPRSHVSRKHDYKQTLVKRGATIGANATIVCGVILGRYCFVGAGAVVTRDVPDYAVVYGNPARVRGWSCFCGVTLPTGDPEVVLVEEVQCRECERRYRRHGLHVDQG